MGHKYSKDNALTLKGHKQTVNCVIQLNDVELASCSDDKDINIWNLQTGLIEMTLTGYVSPVTSIIYLHDGRLASSSVEQAIKVWTLDNHRCDFTAMGHTGAVTCLLQLKDYTIASGSADTSIRIWEAKDMMFLKSLEGHKKTVKCLAQLHDGRLASGSEDETVKIWNVKYKKMTSNIDLGSIVYSLLVIEKTGQLCVGCNKVIKVITCGDDDKNVIDYTLTGHHSSVNCMINNSLTENSIISGGGGTIKIWNLESRTCEYSLEGHKGGIMGLTILNDKRLVSCAGDKTIKIWSIDNHGTQIDPKPNMKKSKTTY